MKKWFLSKVDGTVRDWCLMVGLAVLLVFILLYMQDVAMWAAS